MRQSFAIGLIIIVLAGLWLVNTGRLPRFINAFKAAWGGAGVTPFQPVPIVPSSQVPAAVSPPGGIVNQIPGGINQVRDQINAGIASIPVVGGPIAGVVKALGIKW